MSVPIPENLHIGSRIQIGKDRATILFIGSVKNTKGEWLGIEWDDPNRGKHDGLHQETRYFTCRYPTSGSFIRYHPEKVLTGTTFLTALKDRYTVEDEITTIKNDKYDASKDRGELYFGGNKQIVVETVGFEKILRAQRQLGSLKVVGLAEQLIESAGPVNEIKDTNLVIEDLDLSRNLISKWETISQTVLQLPNLVILRLNQSRLLSPPPTHGLHLTNLNTLALNQTHVSWHDIEILAPQLPQLQDLQLGGNEISQIGVINEFRNLKCLNLEDNLINDWNQVLKLGTLPNLEILFLNDNQLSTLDSISTAETFQKLRFLRIEHNKINDWKSINSFNHYSNLIKLRCKGNPIFKDMTIEDQATQLVGRIKKLLIVNGNTLTNRERTDLERFYLKSCIKDGTTHESIAFIHPRYLELCKIHGEPDLQIQTKEINTSLKDRLIHIQLTQRDISLDLIESSKFIKDLPETKSIILKRFLPTMTIRNMKNMIQRLLKIPTAKQKLFLLQSIQYQEDRDLLVMDMNDDLRDLKFYGIHDGDEILVLDS